MDVREIIQQKHLGRMGLLVFLGALSAFPAFSTDLYLPALPTMTAYFRVPAYQTGFTLTFFFIFYAISLLVSGPLSDRYGRKPVAVAGLTIYAVAGALCVVAFDVFALIGFRILQALGAGAASTVATAIVKDSFQGRRREVTLAVVQSLTVLAPLFAPMIGALILRFTSWRGVFAVQSLWGVLALGVALAFTETVRGRLTGAPLASLLRLGAVLKNRTFSYLLASFSVYGMLALAFISSSSYIFEVTFGLSGQVYSLFYALFGAGVAVGPSAYLVLSRRFPRETILTGCLVATMASGLLIILTGGKGPWPFILALLPMAVSMSCMRPASTYLLLEQHEADAGSASGLITATHMVMGSIGTVIAALDIWGRVQLTGAIILGGAALGMSLWLGLSRPRLRAQANLLRDKVLRVDLTE